MTGTRNILRFLQQLPSRADGLESVMLHNHRLMSQESGEDRRYRDPSNVDYIR
jgi:hypothetical protein